jgi:hypothetical protein
LSRADGGSWIVCQIVVGYCEECMRVQRGGSKVV